MYKGETVCVVIPACKEKRPIERGADVPATVDTDGRTDPRSPADLVDPVADGAADYAKGDGLLIGEAWRGARVRDVPIDAVYDSGQRTSKKVHRVIPRIARLLTWLFVWRSRQKHVIHDFHSLVFFYFFGFVTSLVSLFLFTRLIVLWTRLGSVPALTALALGIFSMMAVRLIVFGMWFDMEPNRDSR